MVQDIESGSYLRIILPESIDEKTAFLKEHVNKIVFGSFSNRKESYTRGLIYYNDKKSFFGIMRQEFETKYYRINLNELNELFVMEKQLEKIKKAPEFELYIKTILPKENEDKIKKLKSNLGKFVFGNFDSNEKERYIKGMLYQNETGRNFRVRYFKSLESKGIDIGTLEEIFVKVNLGGV